MQLSQAKVLITGGSEGIGYETAKQFSEAGAQVLICGRRKELLHKASKELGVYSLVCDVADEKSVKELVKKSIQKMNGFNVLINNAGFGYFDKLLDQDLQRFESILKTNVTGAMLVGRECAKHFVKNEYGNIINIASSAALKGFAHGTAYVASKFALRGMTECWRDELRKYNVRVMLVNPSEVQTSFVANSGRDPREYTPSIMEAKEISHTILSLVSMDDVAFVTEASIWSTNPHR